MIALMVPTRTSFTDLVQNKIFPLRLDPLEGNSRNRVVKTPKITSDTPLGKAVLAKILFANRYKILQLSLEKYASLVSEDFRRESILRLAKALDNNGKTFEENKPFFIKAVADYNEMHRAAVSTLSRIEHAEGVIGANIETLSLLGERIVNPVTEEFFTQAEIILLSQGLDSATVNCSATFDMVDTLLSSNAGDTGEYVSLVRKLNREKSERLGYRHPTHNF